MDPAYIKRRAQAEGVTLQKSYRFGERVIAKKEDLRDAADVLAFVAEFSRWAWEALPGVDSREGLADRRSRDLINGAGSYYGSDAA